MKRTAGPWFLWLGHLCHGPNISKFKDGEYFDPVPIASPFHEEAYCGEHGTEESHANMQLLSTAPELLDMLRTALAEIRKDSEAGHPDVQKFLTDADALIARAEGST